MCSVLHVGGPKTRGSAEVRLPQVPTGQSLMDGGRGTPHWTISSDEDVGEDVGAAVKGPGDGLVGWIVPHGAVVLTWVQPPSPWARQMDLVPHTMDEAQKSGGQVEGGGEDVSATYGPLLSRKRGTVRADTLLLGVGFMRLSGAPQLLARFGQRVHVEVCPEEKVDEVRLARARGGRGLAGHVVGHARFARRAERVRVLDVIEDELRVGQGRSSVRAAGQPFRSAL